MKISGLSVSLADDQYRTCSGPFLCLFADVKLAELEERIACDLSRGASIEHNLYQLVLELTPPPILSVLLDQLNIQ